MSLLALSESSVSAATSSKVIDVDIDFSDSGSTGGGHKRVRTSEGNRSFFKFSSCNQFRKLTFGKNKSEVSMALLNMLFL